MYSKVAVLASPSTTGAAGVTPGQLPVEHAQLPGPPLMNTGSHAAVPGAAMQPSMPILATPQTDPMDRRTQPK